MKKILFALMACALFAACGSEEKKASGPQIQEFTIDEYFKIPTQSFTVEKSYEENRRGTLGWYEFATTLKVECIKDVPEDYPQWSHIDLIDAEGYSLICISNDDPMPRKKGQKAAVKFSGGHGESTADMTDEEAEQIIQKTAGAQAAL